MKKQTKRKNEKKYILRSDTRNDTKVPKKPGNKCKGFSYFGSKLLNLLPCDIKETKNSNNFKSKIKEWIWKNIPSY